jgi:hypothetical protein
MKRTTIGYVSLLIAFVFCLGVWIAGALNPALDAKRDAGDSVPHHETTVPRRDNRQIDPRARFERDLTLLDYGEMAVTPWNAPAIASRVPAQPVRDWTVMVYMNGSDLESETGAATDDLREILGSGIDTNRNNIIILTGGSKRWMNNMVSPNEVALWRIDDGRLVKLAGIGLRNMGDPGTLSGFIDYCYQAFPAENFGLILWDHGGGSIAGYGHDERFQDGTLSLLEMNYAFENSALSRNRLAFLGFDACLMATVEMAVVAAPYAKLLIASQDLEPGDGWDYRFLASLNRRNGKAGSAETVARAIVDTYMDFYRRNPRLADGIGLTLSVVDLDEAAHVMGALDDLAARCDAMLRREGARAFEAFARKRGETKTFGNGSPRDNDCDMVDIGDMARKLAEFFPVESAALLAELETAVLYSRDTSDIDVCGLTAFYLYGGRRDASFSLATYESLQMAAGYTRYLRGFGDILVSHTLSTSPSPVSGFVQSDGSVLWPHIGGRAVSLYLAFSSEEGEGYVIPARHNGRDADVVVFRDFDSGAWMVLGVRNREEYIVQKGVDPLRVGDEIAFYSQETVVEGSAIRLVDAWRIGKPTRVTHNWGVDWMPAAA